MQMSSKSFINAYILYGSICVCVCANCTITWKGGKCTLSNSNGKNMTFDFATYIVGICAVISMQHYNFLFAKHCVSTSILSKQCWVFSVAFREVEVGPVLGLFRTLSELHYCWFLNRNAKNRNECNSESVQKKPKQIPISTFGLFSFPFSDHSIFIWLPIKCVEYYWGSVISWTIANSFQYQNK